MFSFFARRLSQHARRRYTIAKSGTLRTNMFRTVTVGVLSTGGLFLYTRTYATAKEEEETNPRFILYQYSNCPFCSKVRAYLHYSGEDFKIVEVNPITKEETKAITDYKKVPVLVADGIILKESTVVNSILHTHFTTGKSIAHCSSLYPAVVTNPSVKVPSVTFSQEKENMRTVLLATYNNAYNNMSATYKKYVKKEEEVIEYPNKYVIMDYDPKENDKMKEEVRWRRWIDNHFVHLISPNVYRTWEEALQAFDYFTTNGKFTDFQKMYTRYIGALAMYFIGKRLRDRHDLNVDVRSDLYSGLNHWLRGMKGKKFMGGDKPNMADIEMWGMCSAFHGLQCWEDACKVTKIEHWYNRMERYLRKRSKKEIVSANPNVNNDTKESNTGLPASR